MATHKDPAGVPVPARFIPPPRTVSPEARAFLSSSGFPTPDMPDPADKEAWRQHVAIGNAGMVQMTQAMAAPYEVAITPLSMTETTLYEIVAAARNEGNADAAIYYVHGGGFIVGGGMASAYAAAPFAARTGLRTFSVDYRMPPDFPYPHALDDAIEGYRMILESCAAERIVVVGQSAGGGLAASLMLRARDEGLPLPAGCILHTPEVDLTESGDTFETNDTIDTVLKHRLTKAIAVYADGHDLDDPYLSPVGADFSYGFPPTLLLSGTRDLFLSNTVRMHRALRRAGIEADLHVFEAMPHGGFFGAPEDAEVLNEQFRFIDRKLKTTAHRSQEQQIATT